MLRKRFFARQLPYTKINSIPECRA